MPKEFHEFEFDEDDFEVYQGGFPSEGRWITDVSTEEGQDFMVRCLVHTIGHLFPSLPNVKKFSGRWYALFQSVEGKLGEGNYDEPFDVEMTPQDIYLNMFCVQLCTTLLTLIFTRLYEPEDQNEMVHIMNQLVRKEITTEEATDTIQARVDARFIRRMGVEWSGMIASITRSGGETEEP